MISASDGKVTTLGEAMTDGSEVGGRKQGGLGTCVVDWLTTLLRTFQPSAVTSYCGGGSKQEDISKQKIVFLTLCRKVDFSHSQAASDLRLLPGELRRD